MPAGLDGNPDPIVTPQRDRLLDQLTDRIRGRRQPDRPLLVGIDGIDGSGKSTLADEVAARLTAQLRGDAATVVRASVDSFHQPRHVRYRRGPRSPLGFYLDSHDLPALRSALLDPFRSGVGATYQRAVFDEPADRPLKAPTEVVGENDILLFDGIFLGRPELSSYWDLWIFLDGAERVRLERLGYVLAEAPTGGTELIGHVLTWVERIDRYASGLQLYLDDEDPMARADIVVDNNDLAQPDFIPRSDQPG